MAMPSCAPSLPESRRILFVALVRLQAFGFCERECCSVYSMSRGGAVRGCRGTLSGSLEDSIDLLHSAEVTGRAMKLLELLTCVNDF
jgi:hypothetical protein